MIKTLCNFEQIVVFLQTNKTKSNQVRINIIQNDKSNY